MIPSFLNHWGCSERDRKTSRSSVELDRDYYTRYVEWRTWHSTVAFWCRCRSSRRLFGCSPNLCQRMSRSPIRVHNPPRHRRSFVLVGFSPSVSFSSSYTSFSPTPFYSHIGRYDFYSHVSLCVLVTTVIISVVIKFICHRSVSTASDSRTLPFSNDTRNTESQVTKEIVVVVRRGQDWFGTGALTSNTVYDETTNYDSQLN